MADRPSRNLYGLPGIRMGGRLSPVIQANPDRHTMVEAVIALAVGRGRPLAMTNKNAGRVQHQPAI